MTMEGNYRKLNTDLVMQLQVSKQTVQLLETRNLKLIDEAFNYQRIIREQKKIIESFVMNNSVDLNEFLGHLVNGHKQNMTVVTDFIQKMLGKLESLLVNVSSEGFPTMERATGLLPRPRAHRSLSPVAIRTEEPPQTLDSGQEEEIDHNPIEDRPMEQFVTKRRRNYNADPWALENDCPPPVDKPQVIIAPPEPTTLPDGMLSTILETSQDGHNQIDIDKSLLLPEIHEDEENICLETVIASTPNPRKRKSKVISSRTVLSPVDSNREVTTSDPPVKRKHRGRPRKELDDSGHESCSGSSSRPKRRAAPSTLAEPSLRDKLRQ